MIGKIDESSRALLELTVRSADTDEAQTLVAWVDTAFDGELVVPQTTIDALRLTQSAAIKAMLADGSQVVLESYHCQVDWFGEWRETEVIANEGRLPLLGIGLLRGRKLTVDYRNELLSLE